VIDLDIVERNLRRWQARCDAARLRQPAAPQDPQALVRWQLQQLDCSDTQVSDLAPVAGRGLRNAEGSRLLPKSRTRPLGNHRDVPILSGGDHSQIS
jgi:hypothetical protein